MVTLKKFIAKKKINFKKINVYNQKKVEILNSSIKKKNKSYVIPEKEYCADITVDTKAFNPVSRGCLKAIFELRRLNPKKIIKKPSIVLPEFITQEAFKVLWDISEIKPRKNFTGAFKTLENDMNFINSYCILLGLLFEQDLQDVDLFKNTESVILHEVWVWDATYSKILSS